MCYEEDKIRKTERVFTSFFFSIKLGRDEVIKSIILLISWVCIRNIPKLWQRMIDI